MYALGHVGIALLAFAPFGAALLARRRGRAALAGLGGSAALSTLPDVDSHVVFLVHRGTTHTVWFAVLAAFVAGAVATALLRRRGGVAPVRGRVAAVVAVVLLATLSHLLGDVVTPMGVAPFAPLSDSRVSLNLVPARDSTANAGLFALGSLATAAYWWGGTALSRPPTGTAGGRRAFPLRLRRRLFGGEEGDAAR